MAADQPADVLDLAYGLALLLYAPASGTCSGCGEAVDRLTAGGRLCPSCTDPWTTDNPGSES